MDRFNFRLRTQKFRDTLRVFSVRADAIRKCLKATQSEPALKRRRNCAAFMLNSSDFFQSTIIFPAVLSRAVLSAIFFVLSAIFSKDQRTHGHVTVAG